MGNKMMVKWVIILGAIMGAIWSLYPSIEWYTKTAQERSKLELARMRPKHILNLGLDLKGGVAFAGVTNSHHFGVFMAHAEQAAAPTVVTYTNGTADPDGPILRSKQNSGNNKDKDDKDAVYELPAASVVVLRGHVAVP